MQQRGKGYERDGGRGAHGKVSGGEGGVGEEGKRGLFCKICYDMFLFCIPANY
jgi:hypothetical protein